MELAEKFNRTIRAIEKYAHSNLTALEIGEMVALESGYPKRVLSDVFNYLSGYPMVSYIKTRKLTAAYNALSKGNCGISDAIEIAGYSDQPSLTKAFKNLFGVTPGDVLKKKGSVSSLPQPLFWEVLSGNSPSDKIISDGDNGDEEMKSTIFGVPEDTYQRLSKAMELESFYGFTKMFSNYAFELSERLEIPLEDCFKYVDSLRDYGGDYSDIDDDDDDDYNDGLTPEQRLREVGDNEDYQAVFFGRGISVSLISCLMDEYGASVDELLLCDEKMLKLFPGLEHDLEMSFSFYLRAYLYYTQFLDIESKYDSWSESGEGFYFDYITEIMAGVPIEVAFNHVQTEMAIASGLENMTSREMDTYLAYDELENDDYIERMEDEEATWRGGRIDDDLYYDSDNDGFNQYDLENDIW